MYSTGEFGFRKTTLYTGEQNSTKAFFQSIELLNTQFGDEIINDSGGFHLQR